MSYPILYSFKRCPYAMRARMALHPAEIKCEIREIRLCDKPEHMLEIKHQIQKLFSSMGPTYNAIVS